jgi:hypothetical protein
MGNVVALESRKRQEIEGEWLVFYLFLDDSVGLNLEFSQIPCAWL